MTEVRFTVLGVPRTAGSKRPVPHRRKDGSTGIRLIHDSKKTPEWMQQVSSVAREKRPAELLSGPIELVCSFYLPRPKYHYGTGKNAMRVKPQYLQARPDHAPDLTKLVRAVEDAITQTIWLDDGQVCRQLNEKHWTTGDVPRADITIRQMT